MSLIGHQLRINMMNGCPTRTKLYSDYVGMAIPPCGDFDQSGKSKSSSIPPWVKNRAVGSLHDEIKSFMEYIMPSPQEVVIRKDLVRRFTILVESLNPSVTVVPVGSYVTGLNLPTSDIDMVLKLPPVYQRYNSGGHNTLRELYYKLLLSTFCSNIKDVLHASVPLIRITDKKSGIEIDLTAADTHSLKATQAVEKWLGRVDSEIARMLIFVVKTFLTVRRCGTTYTGGINSYVLVWMVVAWVNLEWPKSKGSTPAIKSNTADDPTLALMQMTRRFEDVSLLGAQKHTLAASGSLDLGEALRGFLKFYGSQFDYQRQAIRIEPTPRYTTKLYSSRPFSLSIYDPADESIDMGAKAYGIKHVKESFNEAYRVLTEGTSNVGPGGLLGAMIGGDFTKYIEKRNNIKFGR